MLNVVCCLSECPLQSTMWLNKSMVSMSFNMIVVEGVAYTFLDVFSACWKYSFHFMIPNHFEQTKACQWHYNVLSATWFPLNQSEGSLGSAMSFCTLNRLSMREEERDEVNLVCSHSNNDCRDVCVWSPKMHCNWRWKKWVWILAFVSAGVFEKWGQSCSISG